MANNNTITLSGAFFNAEHNNGITTTAVFAQSSSNRGLITHQGTFVDSTSNRGLASGVVVFQGSAANDGTVAEAVFLDASRNVGTVTASATFANTSVNAGVVQGAAVLIDQASNTGVLASSVQIGASASNTGTVFGTITPHTQGDGYFAYGYYAEGVRTAPPNYATVAHQVGEIWYTYDASGVASLANGEYDDGTSTAYAFVWGVKAAQTGGEGADHPYAHGLYWADVEVIDVGDILYTGQYVNFRAASLNTIEINNYRVTTDSLGIITLYQAINHAYYFSFSLFTVYSDDATLNIGITLYTYANSDTPSIIYKQLFSDYSVNINYEVSTSLLGVVSAFDVINNPYQYGLYWSKDPTLDIGTILYQGQDTNVVVANLDNQQIGGYIASTNEAGEVTYVLINHLYTTVTSAYWSDDNCALIGSSKWYTGKNTNDPAAYVVGEEACGGFISTNSLGELTGFDPIDNGSPCTANPYWGTTDLIVIVGTTILYVGQYTRVVAANLNQVDSLDGLIISTDANGVVTQYDPINHQHLHSDYWSDDITLALGSTLYVGQYTMTVASNLESVTIGEYIVSTDGSGVITTYDPV